jgi:Pyruvate/2-oxoacid:ferredoxin oxidoreductase delta subunit
MIPIQRLALEPGLLDRLDAKTASLRETTKSTRVKTARDSWKASSGTRSSLTTTLARMSLGRECCMYCSDAQGTSIDHYEPIAHDPLKTWVWANHILACTICNSNCKRDKFTLDDTGRSMFLDPTTDDPFDHLRLAPSTGIYVGTTDRGEYTATELLNRRLLPQGRKAAWLDAMDHVREYGDARDEGDSAEAIQRQFRLTQRPNLDAFYSLLRYSRADNATAIISDDVLAVLHNHEEHFYSWLGLSISC